MTRISIIAGGWSVREWDLGMIPGMIIAINDSALHLPRLDVVVSMDRLWTEHRWDWLCKHGYPACIRVDALKNVPISDTPWLRPFHCDIKSERFSTEPNHLNGFNSGVCGFNLAYQFMPSQIDLYGFDFCDGPNGEKYWYPAYPWPGSTPPDRLQNWSRKFGEIEKQCRESGIKVVNRSSRSLLRNFERPNMRVLQ